MSTMKSKFDILQECLRRSIGEEQMSMFSSSEHPALVLERIWDNPSSFCYNERFIFEYYPNLTGALLPKKGDEEPITFSRNDVIEALLSLRGVKQLNLFEKN